ncbi:hypothetical protein SUGI_1169530 [Cryptomeria japonica]|nr:hypothetical protein SUGI_1169530 [Cryptomeria japonica]
MGKIFGRVVVSPITMGRLNEVIGNAMTPVTLSFAAIIIIILLSQWKMPGSFKGAPVWPIVGILPSMILNLGRLYDWYTHILVLNGLTFRLSGPWKAKILTANLENIEC